MEGQPLAAGFLRHRLAMEGIVANSNSRARDHVTLNRLNPLLIVEIDPAIESIKTVPIAADIDLERQGTDKRRNYVYYKSYVRTGKKGHSTHE